MIYRRRYGILFRRRIELIINLLHFCCAVFSWPLFTLFLSLPYCLTVIILRLKNKEVEKMSVERMVLSFAGSFILISLIFSELFSPYWLLFTAFVGANLLQSAFTGFCPLAKILKALGAKPNCETFKY